MPWPCDPRVAGVGGRFRYKRPGFYRPTSPDATPHKQDPPYADARNGASPAARLELADACPIRIGWDARGRRRPRADDGGRKRTWRPRGQSFSCRAKLQVSQPSATAPRYRDPIEGTLMRATPPIGGNKDDAVPRISISARIARWFRSLSRRRESDIEIVREAACVSHGAVEMQGRIYLVEFDPAGRLEADREDCWVAPSWPSGCFRFTAQALVSADSLLPGTGAARPGPQGDGGLLPIPSLGLTEELASRLP